MSQLGFPISLLTWGNCHEVGVATFVAHTEAIKSLSEAFVEDTVNDGMNGTTAKGEIDRNVM